MSGGGRRLSDDERVLWTTVTKAITPIRQTVKFESDTPQATPAPERTKPSTVKPTTTPPRAAAAPLPPMVPLGRRQKARVARGKDAIDGRLDLHGLTQAEAHAALARFLRAASGKGAKLVLVITGKGGSMGGSMGREGGERGVLHRQVPLWLKLPELRDYVIGFEPAHVAHGGEGALYVRVRRPR